MHYSRLGIDVSTPNASACTVCDLQASSCSTSTSRLLFARRTDMFQSTRPASSCERALQEPITHYNSKFKMHARAPSAPAMIQYSPSTLSNSGALHSSWGSGRTQHGYCTAVTEDDFWDGSPEDA